MPSRLSTARPPSLPIRPAVSGETTPSSAAARRGSSKRYGPSVHGIPGAAGRDDRDLVEPVGATRLLSAADLYFHLSIVIRATDGTSKGSKRRTRAATIAGAMLAAAPR